MKLPVILLTAFCLAISASAAQTSFATIYKKDGSATKLIFSNNLKVTCPDSETLRFSDGSGTEIEISHADIHHVSYEDSSNSISKNEIIGNIKIEGRKLVISNHNSDEAKIFDTTGQILMSSRCTENTVLDLSDLPSGVYIVTVGTLRLKFHL